ncbi:MAG: aldo/keto reductase, partial [Paeniglutamicibacter terrestris]
ATEVHPIAAVQNEYSLATRNPELGMVDACAELGTALVAFSPLYRGYLSGNLRGINALQDGDMRHHMPRFSEENYPHNLALVDRLTELATRLKTSAAALSLAWVLAQGEHVHAIPGTKELSHFTENLGALELVLSPAELQQAGEIINQSTIAGARYNVHQQKTIDSEDFAPVS